MRVAVSGHRQTCHVDTSSPKQDEGSLEEGRASSGPDTQTVPDHGTNRTHGPKANVKRALGEHSDISTSQRALWIGDGPTEFATEKKNWVRRHKNVPLAVLHVFRTLCPCIVHRIHTCVVGWITWAKRSVERWGAEEGCVAG
jgi:hypothetical protein